MGKDKLLISAVDPFHYKVRFYQAMRDVVFCDSNRVLVDKLIRRSMNPEQLSLKMLSVKDLD